VQQRAASRWVSPARGLCVADQQSDVMRTKSMRASSHRHRRPNWNSLNGYSEGNVSMRGLLLWLVGIPLPIIILLYLFHVI
jgi:hypothetical protein